VKPIPIVSALVALLSLWSPVQAKAQEPPQRSLLRALYGDLAFEVRTKGQGSVTLAVADDRTQIVVSLMSIDLRRWSDSATRVLAARPPRRGNYVKWEAVVEGPGPVAGSMSLARSILPNDTNLVLLVTDSAFRAVRSELTLEDAKALTGAMRRAALASLPTRPPPMPKAPATKAPATKSPPAPAPKKPPLG
jgi:hypothetical protein